MDFFLDCERFLGLVLNNYMVNIYAVLSVYLENVMYFNLYVF